MRKRLTVAIAVGVLAAAMLPGTVQAAASEDGVVAAVQGTLAQVGLDNAGTATFHDPRLSGNWALVEGCDDEWDVSQANVHIENDVGSWSGSEAYRFDLDLPTEGTWGFGLRGEGGYEGLTAILFFMGGGDEEPYRLRYAGLIFPGTLPPRDRAGLPLRSLGRGS
jgi:hypothetical protein